MEVNHKFEAIGLQTYRSVSFSLTGTEYKTYMSYINDKGRRVNTEHQGLMHYLLFPGLTVRSGSIFSREYDLEFEECDILPIPPFCRLLEDTFDVSEWINIFHARVLNINDSLARNYDKYYSIESTTAYILNKYTHIGTLTERTTRAN